MTRVPLRRPRFSNVEAVILNMLVNADGKPVTARQLARQTTCMPHAIGQRICAIRAKLGEPKYHPTLIVTEYVDFDDGYGLQLAWRYTA
jgi:hypothetical protein